MSPSVSAALLSIPNKQIFQRPMSKNARKLLSAILDWAKGPSGKCFKSSNPTVECYRRFADVYQPIAFEHACHRFDLSTYTTLLGKVYKPNTPDSLLDIMLLKNLDDQSWVMSNSLKSNANRVGDISSERASILYEWLTTNYLMTDFNESDLNKICMMSGDEYNLNTIKVEAGGVKDTDKRNMSYLYAIVRDITSREEVVRRQERAMDLRYGAQLSKAIAYANTPKKVHLSADRSEEWRRERAWLDALADIKQKIS